MMVPLEPQTSSVRDDDESGRFFCYMAEFVGFSVDGVYYATREECTHADGPLSEGDLEGKVITCPWHGSCFDVTDGSVVCSPATEKLETFSVSVDGEVGRAIARKA